MRVNPLRCSSGTTCLEKFVQKREHQVESVGGAGLVPGLHLIGDVRWRSRHHRTGAGILNAARDFEDRKLLFGEGIEPLQIGSLTIISRYIWQRRKRAINRIAGQIDPTPARYQIDAHPFDERAYRRATLSTTCSNIVSTSIWSS